MLKDNLPRKDQYDPLLTQEGGAIIWYFRPSDPSSFEETVEYVFKENPDAHLIQLDNYRILDVTATIALAESLKSK